MGAARWATALIVAALALVGTALVSAQSRALAAFQNAAGQLVVTSADGSYRWVVTNPGETVSPALGFAWAQGSDRLFFAIDQGGEVSLRAADVPAQTITELGRVPNASLTGGEWTSDQSGVLVATGDRLTYYPLSGQAVDILAGQSGLSLRTPAADGRFGWRALSPDARGLVYRDAGGSAVLLPLTGGVPLPLAAGADPSLAGGLWTDDGGLVAVSGANQIAAVSPAVGAVAQVAGASAVPPAPLIWRPGTSTLIYFDGAGAVRAADLTCLRAGPCDPFAASVALLPASAHDLRIVNDTLVFIDGDAVNALPLSCLSGGACTPTLAAGAAAPGTGLDVRAGLLAYTAYTANPNDPADREARVLDVGCLSAGGCTPRTVAAGAQAGRLSPDGRSLVTLSTAGLTMIDLATGAQMPLSDPAPGQTARSARWNG
ncbi:MAG TPA: hypothetical protein VER79_01520 [Candidatus Limnocylindrales bacterium]|nr:hypothetical protein [Candidatus Limnocylindrales bacterium]